MERTLLRENRTLVAGMDEVGRGALAGPVSVGVVVVAQSTPSAPVGLRDSKLIPPATRLALVPKIRRWAVDAAVAEASAAEIDEIGIIAALRLAGRRALALLGCTPDLVILDGNHDWLSGVRDPGGGTAPLFGPDADWDDGLPQTEHPLAPPPVITMVKGDLRCSSVAAASVLAKTTRDAQMIRFADDHPHYGWEVNKGYAAPTHLDALREHGPCCLHRTSWSLPELARTDQALPGVDEVPEAAQAAAEVTIHGPQGHHGLMPVRPLTGERLTGEGTRKL